MITVRITWYRRRDRRRVEELVRLIEEKAGEMGWGTRLRRYGARTACGRIYVTLSPRRRRARRRR